MDVEGGFLVAYRDIFASAVGRACDVYEVSQRELADLLGVVPVVLSQGKRPGGSRHLGMHVAMEIGFHARLEDGELLNLLWWLFRDRVGGRFESRLLLGVVDRFLSSLSKADTDRVRWSMVLDYLRGLEDGQVSQRSDLRAQKKKRAQRKMSVAQTSEGDPDFARARRAFEKRSKAFEKWREALLDPEDPTLGPPVTAKNRRRKSTK